MRLEIVPLPGLPMVRSGDDLCKLILSACTEANLTLANGDVLCVAQKIVSKAEGRLVQLADVTPSPEAEKLAEETAKDPRLAQLILDESREIMRKRPGVTIVRHNLGLVGANAGIDQSNIEHEGGEAALLLPVDPDASAAALKAQIFAATGANIGVIITDSHNRPWRLGTVGAAIGAAGIEVLEDHRGGTDIYGRDLKVTLINRADAMAAAATLLMGETTEKIPAAVLRGFPPDEHTGCAADINRPIEEDLFR